jgi:ribosomal protein S18 acetylase RimI-like enzyme
MMTSRLQISDYQRKYREDMLSLLFYSQRIHTHLDWYKAAQWLDMRGNLIQVAYDGNTLVGFLGISKALNQTSWLRLAAIARGYHPAEILTLLWEQLLPRIATDGIEFVSILVLNSWLNAYLSRIGFEYQEDVVTLYRSGNHVSSIPSHEFQIRSAYVEDLHAIVAVDHETFAASWQMSAIDIRYAQRQAASCTVAEFEGEIVAYEISTRYQTVGHLARLAVHPKMQGKRVGAILLDDLLTRFGKRGVQTMTVNTQASNIISQRLYQRYDFFRNGFDLPIWRYQLV